MTGRGKFLWLVVPLAALACINCAPLYLLVKQAVSPDAANVAWPPVWIPAELSWAHLREVGRSDMTAAPLARSVWVAVASTGASLLLGTLLGWSLARTPRAGTTAAGVLVLARILPTVTLALPFAVLFIRLGLYNRSDAAGLIVAHLTITLPYVVLITYTTFRRVPVDLEDAAMVDGCTPWSAFYRVALPAAKPGIAAAAILAFILSWDEFGYALILQITQRTAPPLIYYYAAYGNVGLASALATVMLIPAVVVAYVVQRYLRPDALAGAIR